jgi:hypothetical protein
VGKGVPGFGIERAPSREGVSALDHQATPAANVVPYLAPEACEQIFKARAQIDCMHGQNHILPTKKSHGLFSYGV